MWYMGETFDKEKNKPYKTLEGGLKAAQKNNLNLYDEDGEIAHKAMQKAQEGQQDAKTDISSPEPEEGQEGAENEATGVYAELVEDKDVPEGAMNPDENGNVKVYDENGNVVGTITEEEAERMTTGVLVKDGVYPVEGFITQVYKGNLRRRIRPSWEKSAVSGVVRIRKERVKALHIVDGKPLYETVNGFFISGDIAHVEFHKDE